MTFFKHIYATIKNHEKLMSAEASLGLVLLLLKISTLKEEIFKQSKLEYSEFVIIRINN